MKNIQKWLDVWRRFSGKGVYPHELAFLLHNPIRKLILPARRLVESLHLAKSSQVLEIGPGSGYFCPEVVRRLPEGELVLLDIQPEMLAKSQSKLMQAGYVNFHLVHGNAESLPFAANTFDIVFLVSVLGEVVNQEACIADIVKVLKPGGQLSITEHAGDPDALTEAEVMRLVEIGSLRCMEINKFIGYFTFKLKKV